MASVTWNAFSSEILLVISELLYNAHPSSLVNFAMSNRACYAAAKAFLFHTIKIFVHDRGHLVKDVQEYLKRLHRDGAFEYVRRLFIYGPGLDITKKRRQQYRRSKAYDHMKATFVSPRLREDDDSDNRFSNPLMRKPQTHPTPVDRVYRVGKHWHPLADLIQQLPVLVDVIYRCPNQFPPCLLQALHEHRPTCRLHIDYFGLRSLTSNPPIKDSHEFMIATSPCLYSINMQVANLSSIGHRVMPIHHVCAVLRLTAGIAPNLKEVHLYCGPGTRWNPDEEHSSFRPHWERLFTAQVRQSQGSGSLSCLHLWGEGRERPVTARLLNDWGTHTDFAALQTLRIDSIVGEDAIGALAGTHNFPSLTTLALTLRSPRVGRGGNGLHQYYQLVSQFIGNLHKLQTLEVTNWSHGIPLGSILVSTKLKTLRLLSYVGEHLTLHDIAQIRERCPLLQELALTIHRSKGDANEVSIYKELGALPKLEHLIIEMDVLIRPRVGTSWGSDLIPADPSFDDYEQKRSYKFPYLNGHIRDAVINSAIDETLACAIFEVISGEKHGDDSVPLQSLEITFMGGSRLSPMDNIGMGEYLTALGRPWRVERSLRNDSQHVLIARELEIWIKAEFEEHFKKSNGQDHITASLTPIFRRIWPEKWEGSPWREDWHSWPLSTSTS